MAVRVIHGINDQTLSVDGHTVAFVAHMLRDVFNIPSDADALLNGAPVTLGCVLAHADILEFVKTFGQKGCGCEYLSEAEVRRMVGDRRLVEMQADGVFPRDIPVYETSVVLHWLKQRLEIDPTAMKTHGSVSAKGLTVDPETRQATFKSKHVDLADKPFRLLYLLVKEFRNGRKHDISDLRLSVWGDDMVLDDTVRRTISRLRTSLEEFTGVELRLIDMRVELVIE